MARSMVADQIMTEFVRELTSSNKISANVLALIEQAVLRKELGTPLTINSVRAALRGTE
jgi:hypothetical protein